MPRWLWYLPLGLILAFGALYAFRLGWIAANMTETAAIEAYAARYLSEAGPDAAVTDCTARPGGTVWLVIRCGRDGTVREYRVNRFGGLVGQDPPDTRNMGEPET